MGAPFVQRTTVNHVLILEIPPGLKTQQANVTTAFPCAILGECKKVYVEMSLGFKQQAAWA